MIDRTPAEHVTYVSAMNVVIAALIGTTALCAADFSGKYKGALQSPVGGNEPVIATIRQERDRITGTIGPRPTQQTPMEDAKVENGKLIFRIAPFGGLQFTLSAEGETLSGPITKIDGTTPVMDRATLHRTGPLTLADTIPALPNEGTFRSMQILKLREQLQQMG